MKFAMNIEALDCDVNIDSSWKNKISEEFGKPYFLDIVNKVKKAYSNEKIYPRGKDIFRAFELCKYEDLKVLILGQDPYHGVGQANGLCFSVRKGMVKPPSLQNIFKEIQNDIGSPIPKEGCLERWAQQGVLLLNSVLTVKASSPGSHRHFGWEQFTDAIIRKISILNNNIVFLLWGEYAIKKQDLIDSSKHLILTSPHPSPFSANRGFLGNRHFSKTNKYLKSYGFREINW